MKLVSRFMLLVAACFLMSAVSVPAFAQSARPQVVDGDTVAVYVDGKRQRVRMVDYDAPETGRFANCQAERALGEKAKRRLRSLINLKSAKLEYTGEVDQYGRRLAVLRLGKASIGARLISEGLALPYSGGERQWSKRLCQ